MLCARRHDDQIPRLDILILARDRRLRGPGREGEGLVDGVDFVADVAAHRDRHDDELGVEPRPEYATEFA